MLCFICVVLVMNVIIMVSMFWNGDWGNKWFPESLSVVPESNFLEVEYFMNGTLEVLSQAPSLPAVGLFFIAHACTHSAKDFWVSNFQCPDCVGLSEEVKVVRRALEKKYVVMAVSSADRRSGCWSGPDVARVQFALKLMLQRHNLTRGRHPIISFGASSGGSFVWGQILRKEVDGGLIQIMSVDSKRYKGTVPVVLSSMPRDVHTAKAMQKNVEDMSLLYPSNVRYEECFPLPVDTSYLMSNVPRLRQEQAAFVVEVLIKHSHLEWTTTPLQVNSTQTFGWFFKKDPTQSNWRDALQSEAQNSSYSNKLLQGLVLTKGRSPLAKSLHRAWAFHEYCADNIQSDISWVEQRLPPSFSGAVS